ncbi:MAG: ABC transporter ATP-binding protein [Gammaproteobacteria bacterium]|nr:ABC transporter ATP-binding protein [Gammaproteobacteria bacterium]
MTNLLTTKDLAVEIGCKAVCKDLNLNIGSGECWAILGMNGVGKTTLLHTLAGLHPAVSGQIEINNTTIENIPPRALARFMGLLLQDYEDAFPGTVMQTVLCGRHPHLKNWQWESEKDLKIARDALAFVEMQGFEDRSILTLSGGERRRVAIATLLCQQTTLLLLDEPTNHLDLRYQHKILSSLSQQIKQNRQAMLMIMHDINLATRYCDHALLMFENKDYLSGKCEDVITAENLSRLYGYPMTLIKSNNKEIYLAG